MDRTIIEQDFFSADLEPTAWLTTDHPSSSYGDPVLVLGPAHPANVSGEAEEPLGFADVMESPFCHAAGFVFAAWQNRWTEEAGDDPHGHVQRFLGLAKAAHMQRYDSGRMVDF